MANIYNNETITTGRVNVFLGWEHFNPKGNVPPGRMDQNLCGRLWRDRSQSSIKLSVSQLESPLTNATPDYLSSLKFTPASIGESFGPTFTNHLFRLQITIPEHLLNEHFNLLWDSNTEAMIMSCDGKPLQGLVGGDHFARRADFDLMAYLKKQNHNKQEEVILYIEIACNGLFGAGRGGDIEPPDMKRSYKLEECCICKFDKDAWNLIHDVTFMQGIFKHLEKDSPRRIQALQISNDIVNAVDVDNPKSYEKGREIAAKYLNQCSGEGQSKVSAMLHSHIDLAWLWPMASTPAKGARTFASTLRLLEEYLDSVFVQSQAQLYEWVRDKYPKLWNEIKEYVKKGRFIPVGGTWVEMDCNLPSGEGLVRQFVYGQNFFKKEFGKRCNEFWLPDTFGYAGQLPQIMKECNIDNFMTQKLSWNLFNKFPHSSFIWEGIDGSTVLAHMPPAETYNSQAFVEEVVKSSRSNRDKSVFDQSILLVGHGDGGGGASPSMLESLKRMKNINPLPKVEFESPDEFFEKLKGVEDKLPRWVGELYFELHRGTFTSQADVKKSNRVCEILLRQVESCSSLAKILSNGDFKYPVEEIDKCWKLVLKNAFHDTLPGSCIGMVYEETKIDYDYVKCCCVNARNKALQFLKSLSSRNGIQSMNKKIKDVNGSAVAVSHQNRNGHPSSSLPIVALSTGPICKEESTQDEIQVIEINEDIVSKTTDIQKQPKITNDNKMDVDTSPSKVLVAVKGLRQTYGMNQVTSYLTTDDRSTAPVQVNQTANGQYIVTNSLVTLTLESSGQISSLKLHRSVNDKPGHESLRIPGNQLIVYDDHPMFWEAWDVEVYSFEKYEHVEPANEIQLIEQGPLRASIQIKYGKLKNGSIIQQTLIMNAGSSRIDFKTNVDWKEKRKCLRVLFDVNVRSDHALYDSQFGITSRTTRFNTSWDIAKFECVGHRFVELSERNFGISLMTDCKYGYSVRDSIMRISLLRSPKSPDEFADIGIHDFTYSIMPHNGERDRVHVIRSAHDLNEELVLIDDWDGTSLGFNGVRIGTSKGHGDLESLGVSCLKKVEGNVDNDVYVVRVYEELGGRGMGALEFVGDHLKIAYAKACNMLEDEKDVNDVVVSDDGHTLCLPFTPFQVRTILVKLQC